MISPSKYARGYYKLSPIVNVKQCPVSWMLNVDSLKYVCKKYNTVNSPVYACKKTINAEI